MLTIGVEPLLVGLLVGLGEVPLLQRSLSQHLYSHLPPASLQGFKAPESATSHTALAVQVFAYALICLYSMLDVTQRGSVSPLQSCSF